jgi:hypothetical protein
MCFASLPARIELDLDEVRMVLGALDRGAAAARGEDLRAIRVATRLITGKVWPELGDLLGEGDQ